ncbi:MULTISPECIES: hypothetical protein [unclassified Anaerobiospirillum]|uniref:hypothetical protein n=1 Tax=unclassified Anaerobiospirillum TaxID=2647410 RepID=UPI001FF2E468|nr:MULTISPECIES: hypothetical protein [unclassified Anaerobiospirillum]MCK0535985.1 hypothetical protein [Anaerobiospirillum sp. NML120511]MCK0541165.1 hypothetical protein [Anaerobiospirillum sp. NML02-A-032]
MDLVVVGWGLPVNLVLAVWEWRLWGLLVLVLEVVFRELFSAKITSDLIILPKLVAYFCSHLCIMPSDLADLYHGYEYAFT